MYSIYKYHLDVDDLKKHTDILRINIPKDSKFQFLAFQGKELYIWYLVNLRNQSNQILQTKEFYVFPTGMDIPDEIINNSISLGSAQTIAIYKGTEFQQIPLVFHVYEKVDQMLRTMFLPCNT